MKNKTLVWVVVIIIVIIGVVLLFTNKKVVAPTQESATITSPTPAPALTDWETYTNENSGYTISYPPSYHVAFKDDLFNFDENKYEKGNDQGVKIQIQKATSVYPSKADVPTVKFAEKITSGPGGTFDIYNVTGLDGTKYFTINVWGNENDTQNIAQILTTFHFSSTAAFSASPVTGKAPLTVKFTNTIRSAGDESIEYGDGTSCTTANPGGTNNCSMETHTYAKPGNYTAILYRHLPTTELARIMITVTN